MHARIQSTYEVPRNNLTTNTNGLVLGVGELCLGSLDSLSVDLVCPSPVVSEDGGGLGDIEALGDGKSLTVVERFEGSKNIDISLHQASDLHEILASLETGAVESPSGVESLVSAVEGKFHIGRETLGNLYEDLTGGRVVDAA